MMQPLNKLRSNSKGVFCFCNRLAEPYLGVGEHRRLYVEAPAAHPVAAGDEGGAAVDAGLDVPQDLVELLAVDLRPLFDAAPEGVADHALQGAGLGLLHELVVHALVHERPRPGAAALALCMRWESVPELRIGSNDCSNTDTAAPLQIPLQLELDTHAPG